GGRSSGHQLFFIAPGSLAHHRVILHVQSALGGCRLARGGSGGGTVFIWRIGVVEPAPVELVEQFYVGLAQQFARAVLARVNVRTDGGAARWLVDCAQGLGEAVVTAAKCGREPRWVAIREQVSERCAAQ